MAGSAGEFWPPRCRALAVAWAGPRWNPKCRSRWPASRAAIARRSGARLLTRPTPPGSPRGRNEARTAQRAHDAQSGRDLGDGKPRC